MSTRIYVVKDADTVIAVVRATSQSQAIGHVVRETFKATVATTEDIVKLLPTFAVEDAAA